MVYAQVVVKYKTRAQALTYLVPANILAYLEVGCYVRIPLRRRFVDGVVTEIISRLPKGLDPKNLKPIAEINKDYKYSQPQIKVLEDLADFYGASLTEVAFNAIKWPNILSVQSKAKTHQPVNIFLEGNWQSRKDFYIELLNKYYKKRNFVFVFSQINYAEDFVLSSCDKFDITTNIQSKKIVKKLFSSDDKFVVVSTSEGIFFPLNASDFLIVDQPSHIGAKRRQRPYLSNGPIADIRSQDELINTIKGDYLIDFNSSLKVINKSYRHIPKKDNPIEVSVIKKTSAILSETLEEIISENRDKNILLLTSMKGWASAMICRECSKIVVCPVCKNTLSQITNDSMYCKPCKNTQILITKCPKCHSPKLTQLGTGINKLYEYLKTNTKLNIGKYSDEDKIYPKDSNIIVSTEKILGLPDKKFDYIFLVDFDRYLVQTDHLSIWNLLYNLKIIKEKSPNLYIQSHFIDHPIWSYINKSSSLFIKDELSQRRQLLLPPYGQIFSVIGMSGDIETLKKGELKINSFLNEQIKSASIFPMVINKRGTKYFAKIQIYSLVHLSKTLKESIANTLDPTWHLDFDF